MSKKKRRKPKPHTIILEKGKFYNVHEGSRTGHPGRIENADYQNDTYLSVTTGSMTEDEFKTKQRRKDYYDLTHRTSSTVFKSFINRRPFIGNRDDYGDKEFTDMAIHPNDEKVVKRVLKNTPRKGFWYKKRKKPSR